MLYFFNLKCFHCGKWLNVARQGQFFYDLLGNASKYKLRMLLVKAKKRLFDCFWKKRTIFDKFGTCAKLRVDHTQIKN